MTVDTICSARHQEVRHRVPENDHRSADGPRLFGVIRALDRLAVAARAGDAQGYRAALAEARVQEATEEQILDSYRWGRRGMGAHPDFDHHGEPHRRP